MVDDWLRILRFFRHVTAGQVTKFRKSMILHFWGIGIWIKVDTGYLRQWFLSNIVWFIMKSVPMCCADNANQSNHTSRYFEQIGQKSTDSHELRDSDEDRKLKWRPWDLWYPILQFLARYENEIENHEMIMQENLNKARSQLSSWNVTFAMTIRRHAILIYKKHFIVSIFI